MPTDFVFCLLFFFFYDLTMCTSHSWSLCHSISVISIKHRPHAAPPYRLLELWISRSRQHLNLGLTQILPVGVERLISINSGLSIGTASIGSDLYDNVILFGIFTRLMRLLTAVYFHCSGGKLARVIARINRLWVSIIHYHDHVLQYIWAGFIDV